jgi:hypothetical protein
MADKKKAPPNPKERQAEAQGEEDQDEQGGQEDEQDESSPAEAPRGAEGKYKRKARTRLKLGGKWYAPGDEVGFATKKEAKQYEQDRAVHPKS